MKKLTKVFLLLVLGGLAACGDARIEDMQVLAPVAAPSQQINIEVGTVTGDPSIYQADVDPKDFKIALQNSLRAAGHGKAGAQRLELTADIAPTDLPSGGLDMFAGAAVRYQLKAPDTDQVLMDEVITSEGFATFYDTMLGIRRARIAVERAMRSNIRRFLELLASRGF